MSFIDRLIMRISPTWALRRIRAKRSALMLRGYEASSGGRRTEGWVTDGGGDADSLSYEIARLRDISRELRRNNGWAKRGLRVVVNNTVGWGIRAKAMGKEQTAKRANRIWRRWSETTKCDFDGKLNFFGIQSLAMKTIVESGEVLIIRRTPPKGSNLPVPVQIRVAEPDLIDTSRNMIAENGNRVIGGIETDEYGRRVAYWLFPRHPGSRLWGSSVTSVRIESDDIIHVYEVDRPGQSRGIPWLSTIIPTIKDLDDFEDAELMKQKIAACFGAFVEDIDGESNSLGIVGGENNMVESLEPGTVSYLSPGQSVKFATPPTVVQSNFTDGKLRKIASGIGVTYEDLTGDYSKVNFSSARMARIAHYAEVHNWRWNMIIPQLCDRVWDWVMDMAVDLALIQKNEGAKWSPPPMPMLDPDKEGIAYTRLIRSGAKTLFQTIREMGDDPMEHLDEIAEVNAELDRRGITLDSDPRSTTTSGQIQSTKSEPKQNNLDNQVTP